MTIISLSIKMPIMAGSGQCAVHQPAHVRLYWPAAPPPASPPPTAWLIPGRTSQPHLSTLVPATHHTTHTTTLQYITLVYTSLTNHTSPTTNHTPHLPGHTIHTHTPQITQITHSTTLCYYLVSTAGHAIGMVLTDSVVNMSGLPPHCTA